MQRWTSATAGRRVAVESVYHSAGNDSGSDSGDEEEGGPVSRRTRSCYGRLLAVVDEVSSLGASPARLGWRSQSRPTCIHR